ncbi:MAG: ParB/RepB/Spo0J family partition protein [Lentimicrobiaceae bacterium]|nr:ParB/RepB/Spo0J family partition protein [Lentimicrobiaceae bacterium]
MEEKKGQKKGLGQGLSAILGNYSPDSSVVSPDSPSRMSETEQIKIQTDLIDANPWQPRTHFEEEALQELAQSIKAYGLIQPITVRKTEDGRYQLIAGERRLRAAKIAELKEIPAYIRSANDMQVLEMGLIENIQRHDLNPIEVALSFQRLLVECNISQEDLSSVVSKSRSVVSNHLRLLKLCPEVQSAVSKGKITMGHAKMLASEENETTQLAVLNKILSEELSVRQVEDLMRKVKQSEVKVRTAKITLPVHVQEIKSSLKNTLKAKVDIKRNLQGKGTIAIRFSSDEELDKIVKCIVGG